ncbi:MAG: pseudouridine synthase [Candidatus Kapabacteria bacterium]|jgi:23S rRNA pseudouridine2605 synthase|nr:pseudouridine synthase [Candidatus Kapabacteria bacterium]
MRRPPKVKKTSYKGKPDKRQQQAAAKPVEKRKEPTLEEENAPVRLNKLIAEAGVCSRRKADELIASGAVKVNGGIIIDLGSRAKRTDFITVFGDPVKINIHHIYILLNKPKDTICTTKDEKGRTTVMDIVRKQTRIYPVGRLDRNTTGVLLMTNDGEMAHRLTHPKFNIPRTYIAGLDAPLKAEAAQKIADGLELDDGKTAPCDLLIDPNDNSTVILTISEGRNHEVKRMFEAVGYIVKRLDRKEFGGISTSGLLRGKYRHLSEKELAMIRNRVGL